MAGQFETNLGDMDEFEGLPLPASPITASGQDPDEVRAMMGMQAHAGSMPGGPAQPAAAPSAGPIRPSASSVEPAGFNSDIARQAMTGQISSGQRQMDTADQEVVDPQIAALRAKKMQDEAAAPVATDYKPGFGTRVLRGLRGVGMGLAQGGIFGAVAGGIDPALTAGGKAYGAPTDAYDVALGKNQMAVSQDTEGLQNALDNFKQAEDVRKQRLGGLKDAGEAFKGAGTTATTQEGEETKAAQLPIDQEKADADKQKAFNESPDGKLAISQQQIQTRTAQADRLRMPQGYMRTRYLLTGEMQPGREPTAEEIAVNRVLGTWNKTHGGQGPQSVQDWQSIYAAAKGGTGAAGGDGGKNLREASSLAEKNLKTLQAQKSAKGYVLLSDAEKQDLDAQIDQARQKYNDLSSRLEGGGTGPGAPSGAQPNTGTQDGAFSADGKTVMKGGKPVPATGPDGKVRMQVPDPQNPGKTKFARFSPDKVHQAMQLGAVYAGN